MLVSCSVYFCITQFMLFIRLFRLSVSLLCLSDFFLLNAALPDLHNCTYVCVYLCISLHNTRQDYASHLAYITGSYDDALYKSTYTLLYFIV